MTVQQFREAFNSSEMPHDATVDVIVGVLTISAINDGRVWQTGPDPEPDPITGAVPAASFVNIVDQYGDPV